jgi:PIN domain
MTKQKERPRAATLAGAEITLRGWRLMMAKRSRRRPPVFLVIDTCVWLDLAKDYSQRSLLSALEDLVRMGQVALITPKLVIDEFKRNRDRVVEDAGRGIGSTLRRAKEILAKFGDEKERDAAIRQITEVDQKSVNYKDAAQEGVKRIEALFEKSTIVKTSNEIKVKAAERAIKGKAPFHRQRNSMNDAILIELFGEHQRGRGGHFAFVTHNIKDFSAIGENDKLPHPDIAKFFSSKTHYFTNLGDALNRFRPEEFQEIMIEQTWYFPPRRFAEIQDAISKLMDQVWYNRHQVWNEKLRSGEAILIADDEERGRDPLGMRIHRGVWDQAERAARRLEDKYGIGEFGPWDDFEWGMLNGKLSALRWVLGDEWDMLDT